MNCYKLQMMRIVAVLLFNVAALSAQEIAGNWQGTLDSGPKLRVILQVEKAADGTLKGTAYSIDQSPNPTPVTTLSFANPTLKFTVDPFHASYEGTLSSDGKTITGTLTQGNATPSSLSVPQKRQHGRSTHRLIRSR